MQAERIPPAISGAVASYGTNWFDPGETEYEAWQQISGLTLPDGVLYVAVPWTWMIEAIRNGRAAELQGANASVTVRFVSEQINVLRNADGQIIDEMSDPTTDRVLDRMKRFEA